eukprot:749126-Hanusia_phi.AAC.1
MMRRGRLRRREDLDDDKDEQKYNIDNFELGKTTHRGGVEREEMEEREEWKEWEDFQNVTGFDENKLKNIEDGERGWNQMDHDGDNSLRREERDNREMMRDVRAEALEDEMEIETGERSGDARREDEEPERLGHGKPGNQEKEEEEEEEQQQQQETSNPSVRSHSLYIHKFVAPPPSKYELVQSMCDLGIPEVKRFEQEEGRTDGGERRREGWKSCRRDEGGGGEGKGEKIRRRRRRRRRRKRIIDGQAQVVHEEPFYEREEDVPNEAVRFAGKTFRLKAKTTRHLQEFQSLVRGSLKVPEGVTFVSPILSPLSNSSIFLSDGLSAGRAGAGADNLFSDASERKFYIYRPTRPPPARRMIERQLRKRRKQVEEAKKAFDNAQTHIDSYGRLCVRSSSSLLDKTSSSLDKTSKLSPALDSPALQEKLKEDRGKEEEIETCTRRRTEEEGQVISQRRSVPSVRDLVEGGRPPSPRYDESFLLNASYACPTDWVLGAEDPDHETEDEDEDEVEDEEEEDLSAGRSGKSSNMAEGAAESVRSDSGVKVLSFSSDEGGDASMRNNDLDGVYKLTLLSLEVHCEVRGAEDEDEDERGGAAVQTRGSAWSKTARGGQAGRGDESRNSSSSRGRAEEGKGSSKESSCSSLTFLPSGARKPLA